MERPIRITKSKLLKEGELERAIELLSRRLEGEGTILILIDADDDCAAEMARNIRERVHSSHGHLSVSVVVANSEFESWFIAAAESLRGRRGLPSNLTSPLNPESIRGAKEWLRDHMSGPAVYSPTVDQPALAAVFDIEEAARKSPSFRKFLREFNKMTTAS